MEPIETRVGMSVAAMMDATVLTCNPNTDQPRKTFYVSLEMSADPKAYIKKIQEKYRRKLNADNKDGLPNKES